MWFTKDSEWKCETRKGEAGEAGGKLPKKHSKSARDRRRVHGLTAKICSAQTQYLKSSAYITIVSVIAETVAEIDAKFTTSDPRQREGGFEYSPNTADHENHLKHYPLFLLIPNP